MGILRVVKWLSDYVYVSMRLRPSVPKLELRVMLMNVYVCDVLLVALLVNSSLTKLQ
jgi:hypothetical protein